jgi:hypothetical protein
MREDGSVGSAPPHNRLIMQVARDVLRPAGLTQQGRSRVWLDDHGWWVGVVEFQPSAWSRGTYLNVGAMWLWRDTDDHHVYFDLGHRVDDAGFVEYESDDQFTAAFAPMARRALDEVAHLRGRVPSVDAAAELLRGDAAAQGGWAMWDAAVALGLAGRRVEAAQMFRKVAADDDDLDWWLAVKQRARELSVLVTDDPERFAGEAERWISRYREALKLAPLPSSLR